ncbi:hypothetical protein LCI18_010918 [Fusarium solani-melongenae]|uniref:Uncharacterized protein n=1 Tax=Fusarium solani subsp. cucurbitae TaxID=2747967 RepID=A0ACD3ZF85_FUSSC|nr:hypothetical protein LCI18_010918 [Fusarium solani-melongenae]
MPHFPTSYPSLRALPRIIAYAKDAASMQSLPRQQIPTSSSRANIQHQSNPQHERHENHRPNTTTDEEYHYVLTLWTDDAHHEEMTALRRQWFPTRLLKVEAHVTLFHALPGSKLHQLKQDIAEISQYTTKFAITVKKEGIYEMNKGVGIRISEGQWKAAKLRSELRDKWEPFLSRQDQQERWRGHYTIMNKEDDKARVTECLKELQDSFEDSRGTVNGLKLWRYDRGWWREVEAFSSLC